MLHPAHKIGLAVVAVGLLWVAGANLSLTAFDDAPAKDKARLVKDDAKLFSDDAIKDTNEVVTRIKQKHRKDLVIETREKGPETLKELSDWAKERSDSLSVDGVYLVITKEPKKFYTYVPKKTRESGVFTKADQDAMIESLKGLGKDRNGTLLKVATSTLEAMDQHAKKPEIREPPPKK